MADPGLDRRAFPRRWGTDFVRAGEALFRIWAPQAETLSLDLEGKTAPMTRDGDGWFELMAEGVEPGQRYSFVLPDGRRVPDPASRAQQGDVHGPSLVVDPTSYRWRHTDWTGRPWREAVVYELHVGTFTPDGTFCAAAERLGHLAGLGITAVELMPLAQFSGNRGWGYDGVLPFAPHNAYGSPDDLKLFIDEAHGLGLMVLLDVVYNHFGPDGNYLPSYAADFFDAERHTPWGAAIAYHREPVRQFFIDNALYWLEEFNADGLRLDAVDQIADRSEPELLIELARQVRAEFPDRHVHLTTEDNRNITRLHARQDGKAVHFTAEWNDDFHNAAHVLLTGESEGYYEDFADDPLLRLARSLAEGFAYQGEASPHADGAPRGEPSAHLPTPAFIDFLQNHDQVGNRALGERLSLLADGRRIAALTAMLLLSPHIPLVFMGEEWGETRPFFFFTDFEGQLADAVREGRRKEFAKFSAFASKADRDDIPDPNAPGTFERSKLDWATAADPQAQGRLELFTALLALRRDRIVPLLDDTAASPGTVLQAEGGVLAIDWQLPEGTLQLRACLADAARIVPPVAGQVIYDSGEAERSPEHPTRFDPWQVRVAVTA